MPRTTAAKTKIFTGPAPDLAIPHVLFNMGVQEATVLNFAVEDGEMEGVCWNCKVPAPIVFNAAFGPAIVAKTYEQASEAMLMIGAVKRLLDQSQGHAITIDALGIIGNRHLSSVLKSAKVSGSPMFGSSPTYMYLWPWTQEKAVRAGLDCMEDQNGDRAFDVWLLVSHFYSVSYIESLPKNLFIATLRDDQDALPGEFITEFKKMRSFCHPLLNSVKKLAVEHNSLAVKLRKARGYEDGRGNFLLDSADLTDFWQTVPKFADVLLRQAFNAEFDRSTRP